MHDLINDDDEFIVLFEADCQVIYNWEDLHRKGIEQAAFCEL